jgi:hypothetical protein
MDEKRKSFQQVLQFIGCPVQVDVMLNLLKGDR